MGDRHNLMLFIYRKPIYTDSIDFENYWQRCFLHFDLLAEKVYETNLYDFDLISENDRTWQAEYIDGTTYLMDRDGTSDDIGGEWRISKIEKGQNFESIPIAYIEHLQVRVKPIF
jgi:hypothetical protein